MLQLRKGLGTTVHEVIVSKIQTQEGQSGSMFRCSKQGGADSRKSNIMLKTTPRAKCNKGGGDGFPWGAWPRDAAVDTHKQAGRQSTVLTGASLRSCHVTKRFRILATLKQGNKSMYSNTSECVHIGLRLDWGKCITGQ